MKYRPSLAMLGAALLFSLACMGSDEEVERQAAEIAQLQSELVDRDEAIAATGYAARGNGARSSHAAAVPAPAPMEGTAAEAQ